MMRNDAFIARGLSRIDMQLITKKTKRVKLEAHQLVVLRKNGGGVGVNASKGTMQKTFESYEALRSWVDLPATRLEYNIVYVIWHTNTVRLERRS